MNQILHAFALSSLVACTLFTLGCGGMGTGANSTNNALVQAVAQTRASYQIIDLDTGTLTATGSIPDLATNPAYRTSQLVMCLVQPGAGAIGTASGGVGEGYDAPATVISYGRYYLGVFTTTQAQWTRIAGTTPWTQLSSASSPDDIRIGDTLPAIGISFNAAQAACAAFTAVHGMSLSLPSDAQWEIASRAGSTQTYPWGNSTASAVVDLQALVWESQTQRGAQPVGMLQPNAFGFYDMVGNVWELTAAGNIRGGSWNDPLATGRCANIAKIAADTAHLLVGVRLCYTP